MSLRIFVPALQLPVSSDFQNLLKFHQIRLMKRKFCLAVFIVNSIEVQSKVILELTD